MTAIMMTFWRMWWNLSKSCDWWVKWNARANFSGSTVVISHLFSVLLLKLFYAELILRAFALPILMHYCIRHNIMNATTNFDLITTSRQRAWLLWIVISISSQDKHMDRPYDMCNFGWIIKVLYKNTPLLQFQCSSIRL